jgi:hypothetical protein
MFVTIAKLQYLHCLPLTYRLKLFTLVILPLKFFGQSHYDIVKPKNRRIQDCRLFSLAFFELIPNFNYLCLFSIYLLDDAFN